MSDLVRNIIIGIALILLAYLFALYQGNFFGTEQSAEQEVVVIDKVPEEHITEDRSKEKAITTPKKNAAAEGLSKFYASINPEMDRKGPKIKNNIVYLPDPKGDLVKQLEAIRMVTRPLQETWRGSKENRPFRPGETLFQKLTEYGNNEGLEIIWWLNRDFIIKDPFRIDKSILKTAYQIGEAVEGHFHNGIKSYFCNKQRAIILISQDLPYLDNECVLLTTDTH